MYEPQLISKIVSLLTQSNSRTYGETKRTASIDEAGHFISDNNGNIKNPGFEQLVGLLEDFPPLIGIESVLR